MKRALWILLAVTVGCLAQNDAAETEEEHLRQVLSEAGSSPLEFIRAAENHLAKFPDSPRRADLEAALVKAAIDAKDDRRILLYGERVLEREPDDLEILQRVTEILLAKKEKEKAERALQYAQRYEEVVRSLEDEKPASPSAQLRFREQLDRGLGRALALQAQAEGQMGKLEEAISLAQQSYATYPTAESAREIGKWLGQAGRPAEAIAHFADAFAISDPHNTDAGRAADRKRMGELYRKLHGSETGLGDLILQAYDRTSALLERRREKQRLIDPNAGTSDPMEFTLSGLNGERLNLSALRGKVLILDFWATWCSPCRAQHPLYEEAKQRFKDRADVMFLSINTDTDRTLVEPFLEEQGWTQEVYFEDGLSRALRVSSIPTTIIVSKRGRVVNRLVGFIPDRFVDMLAERVEEALAQ